MFQVWRTPLPPCHPQRDLLPLLALLQFLLIRHTWENKCQFNLSFFFLLFWVSLSWTTHGHHATDIYHFLVEEYQCPPHNIKSWACFKGNSFHSFFLFSIYCVDLKHACSRQGVEGKGTWLLEDTVPSAGDEIFFTGGGRPRYLKTVLIFALKRS